MENRRVSLVLRGDGNHIDEVMGVVFEKLESVVNSVSLINSINYGESWRIDMLLVGSAPDIDAVAPKVAGMFEAEGIHTDEV